MPADNLANSPPAVGESVKPRYRLDTDSSATLELPDGRKLGYAQYGSLNGRAVFYLHGTPGARLEAAAYDQKAKDIGARIIGVDRPGLGWSSPHPGRKMLDHPKDIEHLAGHLGLDEYGVLGMSGGGPYALACAASLPASQLKAVAIGCGLGTPDMSRYGMRWQNYLGLRWGYRYVPSLCGWWFKSDAGARLDLNDTQRLKLMKQQFAKSGAHEKDVEAFKEEDLLRLMLRTAREYWGQGLDGVTQDGHVICTDWGFRVEDIRKDLPVRLWHGKLDVFVPPSHGEQVALRLGSKAHLRLVDETHLTLFTDRRGDILEDLVKAMESGK